MIETIFFITIARIYTKCLPYLTTPLNQAITYKYIIKDPLPPLFLLLPSFLLFFLLVVILKIGLKFLLPTQPSPTVGGTTVTLLGLLSDIEKKNTCQTMGTYHQLWGKRIKLYMQMAGSWTLLPPNQQYSILSQGIKSGHVYTKCWGWPFYNFNMRHKSIVESTHP